MKIKELNNKQKKINQLYALLVINNNNNNTNGNNIKIIKL